MIGGPSGSFDVANLALTAKRGLVGLLDVYVLFPDKAHPVSPAFPITFKGDGGTLDDKLKGTIEFPITSWALAGLQASAARPSRLNSPVVPRSRTGLAFLVLAPFAGTVGGGSPRSVDRGDITQPDQNTLFGS